MSITFTHHPAELCEEDRYCWAGEQEPHREGLLPRNELELSAVGTLRGEPGDPQTLHSQGICQKHMDIHGNHVVYVCVVAGVLVWLPRRASRLPREDEVAVLRRNGKQIQATIGPEKTMEFILERTDFIN